MNHLLLLFEREIKHQHHNYDEFGLWRLTEQGESILEQIEKVFWKESTLEVSSSLDEVLQESQENIITECYSKFEIGYHPKAN